MVFSMNVFKNKKRWKNKKNVKKRAMNKKNVKKTFFTSMVKARLLFQVRALIISY